MSKISKSQALNVNASNDKMPALLEAAAAGRVKDVERLLKEGADPNEVAKSGYTALMFASRNGHPEVARVLLESGAKPNGTDSHTGSTPLHLAALFGEEEIVRLLLRHGADVHLRSKNSQLTPLDYAKNAGHHEIIRTLEQAADRKR